MPASIPAFHLSALAAMSADFDAESMYIELNVRTKWLQPVLFEVSFLKGRSTRISLWRRNSVTPLVPIGYLAQPWINWLQVNFKVKIRVKIQSEGGGAFRFNFNFHPIFEALTVQNAVIQAKG